MRELRRYVLALAMFTVYTALCGPWIQFFSLYASKSLGMSMVLVSLLYSLSDGAATLGSALSGYLCALMGYRASLAMLYGVSISSLALVLSGSAWLCALGFVAYFVGVGGASPIVHAVTLDIIESARARGTLYALATRFAPSIAAAVTMPIGGYLMMVSGYGALALMGVAALGLVAVIALSLTPSSPGERVSASPRESLAKLLRVATSRGFRAPIAVFAIVSACGSLTEWLMPIYFSAYGLNPLEYGISAGVSSLAIALSSLASGALVDTVGIGNSVLISSCASSALSAAMVIEPRISPIAYVLDRASLSLSSAAPALLIASRFRSSERAIALSVYRVATFLASMTAPIVGGALTYIDIRAPLAFKSATLAIIALMILRIARQW